MQPQRRNARLLLLAGLVASACSEQSPTAVPRDGNPPARAAAAGQNPPVKVKTMQLSSNTLRIDGPAVSGIVSIGNSGVAIQTGVVIRADITQGAVSKEALNIAAQCSGAEGDTGKLPIGTCEMAFSAVASNSASGSPDPLVPGAAMFTLRVVQTSNAGDIELATKNLLVNLVSGTTMTVTVDPTTIRIDGSAATATAVIQNLASSVQGVLLQGYIVQGDPPNTWASGGTLVACGSNTGVLPPGTCTMTIPVSASSSAAGGPGALVGGAATLRLELIQTSGSGNTTLAVGTAGITLVAPPAARIASLTISPTLTFGASNPYTAVLENTGPSLTTVVLQGTISQGAANRGAGGVEVQCSGEASGTLPTGTCSVDWLAVPFNAPNGGTGTLVPGPATLQIDLVHNTTTLDTKIIPVTLVMSGPGIIGIEMPVVDVLAGESLEYTAILYNPRNKNVSSAGIQGYLTQDPIVDFGTGGTTVMCPGAKPGTLPPGICRVNFTLGTRNTLDTPLWSPGAATFRLELFSRSDLLDSRSRLIFIYRLS